MSSSVCDFTCHQRSIEVGIFFGRNKQIITTLASNKQIGMAFNPELKTNHIFLDSSIIIREGYLTSRRIDRLIAYSREGLVKLHIVDISVEEVLYKVGEKLTDIYRQHSSVFRFIGSKVPFLRHSAQLTAIFAQNSDFDRDGVNEEIAKSIREKINASGITEHKVAKDAANKVFYNYFNKNKPFGDGRKKSEFPDAFILETVAQFCRKNECRTYIVSKDLDILQSNYENIFPISELDALLGLIDRVKTGKTEADQLAKRFFVEDTQEVERQISRLLGYELTQLVVAAWSRDSRYSSTNVYLPKFNKIQVKEVYPNDVATDTQMRIYADFIVDFALPFKPHENQPEMYELGQRGGTSCNEQAPDDGQGVDLDHYRVYFWSVWTIDVSKEKITLLPRETEYNQLEEHDSRSGTYFQLNIS